MGARSLAVSAELRRYRGSIVGLVLVVALAGALVLTAVAGARRSASAYPRFLTWANASDLGTGGAASDEELTRVIDELKSAPFTAAYSTSTAVGRQGDEQAGVSGCCSLRGPSGATFAPFEIFSAAVDVDPSIDSVDAPKVLSGRLFDPTRADEAIASFGAADRLGVDVGDTIELIADDGSAIDVTIVGTVAVPGLFPTLSGSSFDGVALTPAFRTAHPDLFEPGNDGISVKFEPGTERDEVAQWVAEHVETVDLFETSTGVDGIERAIAVETDAIWAVAGVLAIAALTLIGQLLLRHTILVSSERERLCLLGFSRRDLVVMSSASSAMAGIVGALGASSLAIVGSWSMPIGLARIAEPDPGIRIDLAVVVIGWLAIAVAVTATGSALAWWSVRTVGASRPQRHQMPLATATGTTMLGSHLLTRGSGEREVRPAAATAVAVAVLGAMLVGSLVVVASLQRLSDDPALAGATWDAAVAVRSDDGHPTQSDVERTRSEVERRSDVDATSLTGWYDAGVGDDGTFAHVQIFEDGGGIGPAIAAGREPRAAGEVAMGADVMQAAGLELGDEVVLTSMSEDEGVEPAPVPVRVVGVAVLAPPIFNTIGPGDGVAMPEATARLFGGEMAAPLPIVLARFTPGTDVALATTKLATDVASDITFGSDDRTVTGGARRVALVPRVLAALLGAACAAGLFHVLVTTYRRRAGEFAVAGALGATPRQIRGARQIHAFGVGVALVFVAVPFGVLAGRLVWEALADYLGVVPVVEIPWWRLAAVSAGGLAIGQSIAVVSNRRRVETLRE